jgi:hypothetical protein
MANFSLVANNRFQNRSFDDLLRPLAMYTEEYNTLENAIGELDSKASVWEGMADEERDPVAYAQYKRYADDLRNQATQLSRTGLNPNSRRDLLNLKRRYASEIVPIEQAYTNRKVQADEQRKAMLQNPTLLLSRRADMTSLDRYLDNPQLGYEQYNGALLTKQVGDAASAIAKELRDYGKGKPLDGFTKTWLQQHGYTAGEVAQAINNPDSPRSSAILNTLVNNVMADSGVPQWADRATLNQAYSYARQGLWQAVGQTNVQVYTDEAAKLAAQEASQKRVARYANDLQNRQTNHTLLIPRALRSQQEIADNTRKINDFVKRGYMKEVNGRYEITDKGRKAYATNINVSEKDLPKWMDPQDRMAAIKGLKAGYSTTDFRRFMDSLNGGKALYDGKGNVNGGKGNFMPTHAGNLFTNAVKRNSSEVYDMYHSTEYVRQVPKSYAEELKRQVMSEPEILQSLDFNGKDGFKGKNINKSDLEKFTPTRVNYSRYGNTITWINDKGETVRTNAPVAVNERVSNTVQMAMNNAALNAAVLRKGMLPKFDAKGNPIIKDGVIQFSNTPLTQDMMQAYYNDWQEEMDVVNSIGSMYVSPSTTKNQEYKPYEFGTGFQGGMFDFSSEE